MVLASLDRRSKNVRVLPVVITELEFGNIERHIFPAHFMERADDAALEDRPEAFDGLSMDCSYDVLASRMVNGRVWVIPVERIVAWVLIGTKQADPVRHRLVDEGGESGGLDIRDHASNHIALAANSADDRRFAGTDTAGSTAAAALIPMPVFCQAADESFIDFDNSAELSNIFHESNADAVTHIPSGFKRTEPHITPNLASANSLFAGEHQMNDAIPIAERLIGVFEDCPGNMRKAIAVWRAFFALPMPLARWQVIYSRIATTRATDALRPAARDQVSLAGLFVWKQFLELRDGQLMDLWGLFCAGHGLSSLSVKGRYHEPKRLSSTGTSPS